MSIDGLATGTGVTVMWPEAYRGGGIMQDESKSRQV